MYDPVKNCQLDDVWCCVTSKKLAVKIQVNPSKSALKPNPAYSRMFFFLSCPIVLCYDGETAGLYTKFSKRFGK